MATERCATSFPWGTAMQFGLGVLRLSPADFWAMTPRELASAMTAWTGGEAGAPDRSALGALMTAFPDQIPDDRAEAAHG